MAKLARKITKQAFDKLSKDLQALYVENDDDADEFLLELDEPEDDNPDALRRARDREKQKAKDAEAKLRAANDKIKELETGSHTDDDDDNDPPPQSRSSKRKAKDIATLEAAWKEKVSAVESERDEKLSAKDAYIKRTLISGAADRIASKISTAPKLLAKAIIERLDVDFDDDEPRLVVLDGDGKPSSLTLDKLEKEFSTNKEYASIIIGTKASGGGAPRNGPDQRPARGGASEDADMSKMAPKDLKERLRQIKEAT